MRGPTNTPNPSKGSSLQFAGRTRRFSGTLLLALASAATAYAQPTISSIVKLSTNLPSGAAGDTIRATVTGTPAGTYNNNATIRLNSFIDFYNPSTNALVASSPVSSFTRVALPASNQYLFNLPVGLASGVNVTYNMVVRSQNDAGTTFATETNPPPVTFTVEPGANITSITPAKSPVNSTATVTVVVSGQTVSPSNSIILTDPSTNAQVAATAIQTPNSTTIRGTFNTTGLSAGLRHLTVQIGAQNLTALQAFEITPAVVTTPAVIPQSSSQAVTFNTTSGTFNGATTVDISPATGLTLGPVVVNSANQVTRTITVDAAAPITARTVTVVHANGAISSVSTPLTIIAAGLTAVPASGRQGSQVAVGLTGTGVDFTSGTWTGSVSGAGVTTSAVTPTGATTANVTLTIPASAATGTRVLQVTNGAQTLSAAFEILPVTISVLPTGTTSGTDVTLNVTGVSTNFQAGVTTVSFTPNDIVLLGPVNVTGPTTLSVPIRVPAGSAVGPRTVTVATGALEAPTTTFNVLPVSISVSPTSGNLGTTTLVAVTGTNTSFTQGVTTVSVSGTGDVTAGPATVTGAGSLTVPITIPSNAIAGVRTLTVTTGAQTASTTFSIGTPSISLNRTTAQQSTNFTLAITGTNTNFTSGQTTVSISGTGVTASAPVVTNNTLLTTNIVVSSDAPQTARTLTVQTGQQVVTAIITVTPPGLTITPTQGLQGTQVTLSLSRSEPLWVQGTTIALVSGTGVTAGPVTVSSPTTATVVLTIAANAAPGQRIFTTQTGNTSATTTFTVVDATPRITQITPASGAIGTTFDVVITGVNANFSAAAPPQVSFGQGVTVNSVTVNSADQITVRITLEFNATAGPRTVTAQAGATTLTSVGGFTVGTRISGQPFQCQATAGVPPIVRAEGLTELVGDLVLVCTGGTAGELRTTNIQLFLNTNITSRIVGSGDETEALLILDENITSGSGTTATTPGIFRGRKVTNAENAVVWAGIPIVAPGPGQRVIRITNVRANAAGLGASTTLIPTQVVAFISASPSQSIGIDNPQQVVAYVQRGVVSDLRACNGTEEAGSALNLLACVGQNNSGTRDLLTGSNGNMQFAVRFQEGFQTAFKPQLQTSPISQMPSVPGTSYHSESGFVLNSSGQPFSVGGANTGTRLMARFTNIPANVRLFVTTGPSYGSSATAQAALVQLGANNVIQVPTPGTLAASPGDKVLFCANVTGDGRNAVEIPVVNGTATAVWEIIEANPSVNETLTFGVAAAYTNELTAGRPETGLTSVNLGFAPAYAPGTATTSSTILPIPRFVENTSPTDAFRIEACTTTLLFPYVASVAGFDTGIAIANTSRDPFSEPNRRLQAGGCMLHFYGTDTAGVRPPSQRTSRALEPGETLTMVLSTGGGYGLVGVPNFQGYVMAQCDFQFAHGFAFLTDGPIGAARVAEGYLALVLDGGAQNLRGSTNAEVRGH